MDGIRKDLWKRKSLLDNAYTFFDLSFIRYISLFVMKFSISSPLELFFYYPREYYVH